MKTEQQPMVSAETLKQAVSAGHAIIAIENDTQKQIAMQHPRTEKKILDDALAELDMDDKVAQKAFYSIPYKDYENRDRDGQPKITYVQGLSIQGAMALARRWGNCANGARITRETDERIELEGVFLDYETNLRTTRPFSVSRTYVDRQTKTARPLNETRLNMAIQAGFSKAVRNAILASLPEYLKNQYFKKATDVATGKTPNDTRTPQERFKATFEDIKKGLAEYGVTSADMVKILGKARVATDEDLIKLRGTLNALIDGITTKDQLLGSPEKKQDGPKGQITMGQVLGDKNAPEPGSNG